MAIDVAMLCPNLVVSFIDQLAVVGATKKISDTFFVTRLLMVEPNNGNGHFVYADLAWSAEEAKAFLGKYSEGEVIKFSGEGHGTHSVSAFVRTNGGKNYADASYRIELTAPIEKTGETWQIGSNGNGNKTNRSKFI